VRSAAHVVHTSQLSTRMISAFLLRGQEADSRMRSAQALQCAYTGRSRAWLMQRSLRSEQVRDRSAARAEQQSLPCCSSGFFCMCIVDLEVSFESRVGAVRQATSVHTL